MVTDPAYLQKAVRDLKKDPRMRKVVNAVGALSIKLGRSVFIKLAQSIVGQQLSSKASKSIWNKLVGSVTKGTSFTPQDILKATDNKLRSAGLSGSKALYLKELAQYVEEKKPTIAKLEKLSNEEIIVELTQIKGVGVWTAEMFLMFGLGRTDVLPIDDLGIRKGFMGVYSLRSLPDGKKIQRLAKSWNGHYTVGCLYLWQFLDS